VCRILEEERIDKFTERNPEELVPFKRWGEHLIYKYKEKIICLKKMTACILLVPARP